MNHLQARAEVAVRIAKEAGQLLLGFFGNLDGYAEKSRANLVSAADLASERLLVEALGRAFPGDLVLAEETDGVSGANKRRAALEAAEFSWAIDPLDGTTNFIHQYPVFSVSIGLLARGRPVLGVVYSPYRDEMFTGSVEAAAQLNGQPISVSAPTILAEALVGTGFVFMEDQRLDRILRILREVLCQSHGVRRAGSAALDLCDLAAGRLDAYYETGLAPWDVAAGQAIVEAAGGRVSDFSGETHDVYGQNVLATNAALHGAMVELLTRFT